jgi:hypothetical protein
MKAATTKQRGPHVNCLAEQISLCSIIGKVGGGIGYRYWVETLGSRNATGEENEPQ